MIGDAYFQVRSQVGTALFSLLRLASETSAGVVASADIHAAQEELREPFVLVTLGSSDRGKTALLNALFEREFCATADSATTGKLVVFQHGDEARDSVRTASVIDRQRPDIFLRNFTIVHTPGDALPVSLLPEIGNYLPAADVIFFVIAPGDSAAESWDFLARLGREALRRMVFVVWQADRAAVEEAAMAVKRLRQSMLKGLGQACPIFTVGLQESNGRGKLIRWLESEVVFSARRRMHLEQLDQLARQALRGIIEEPQAAAHAWQRAEAQLRRLEAALAEREEQTERQIAGSLWTLAQSFDVQRQRGESLLHPHLLLTELARNRGGWRAEFAREMEAQACESFAACVTDTLALLQADLRQAYAEHQHDCRATLGEELPGECPQFPPEKLAETIGRLSPPLDMERVLVEATTRASRLLRWPVLAAAGAGLLALGALPFVGVVAGAFSLAAGAAVLALVLGLVLRQGVVASFGRDFTANRAAVIGAIETPLRRASEEFYAEVRRPLEGRLTAHAAERHRHEPLLARIQQLEETFTRIARELKSGGPPGAPQDHGPDEIDDPSLPGASS